MSSMNVLHIYVARNKKLLHDTVIMKEFRVIYVLANKITPFMKR